MLAVDPGAGTPLHRQVYDGIRTAILSGRLRSGDRLPATRTLAEQLSLSRTTITEAYDQLQAEGYLFGKHGSGTYVAPNLPEDTLQTGNRSGTGSMRGRPIALSAWGERLSRTGMIAPVHPPVGALPFDFHPHRIAEDSFPWDAWEAAVDRALSNSRVGFLEYPAAAGHPDLREAVASHIARFRAVACSAEQVVIVNGSQQGLNLLAHLLLESGDRVAVEDPGYPSARLAFEAHGLEIRTVPVDDDGMVVDRLAAMSPVRAIHVTPSHQYPTGATMSLSRRLALLQTAEQMGCVIVEDDYDSEFRYEGRPVESLQGLDHSGLVVYAGSFSKSILASLRLGFLVLPPALAQPFAAAKSLWDSGTPVLEQAVLAEFMRSGDFERHIRRMRRIYRDRRDALVAALIGTFGERITIGQSHSGLSILVRFEVPLGEDELVLRAAEAGIGLRGVSRYYSNPPPRPTILMGFGGLTPEAIFDGVQRLAEVIGHLSPSLV